MGTYKKLFSYCFRYKRSAFFYNLLLWLRLEMLYRPYLFYSVDFFAIIVTPYHHGISPFFRIVTNWSTFLQFVSCTRLSEQVQCPVVASGNEHRLQWTFFVWRFSTLWFFTCEHGMDIIGINDPMRQYICIGLELLRSARGLYRIFEASKP